MTQQVEKFFDPCLKLYWRGKFGKLGDHWYPDTAKDAALLQQFMREAGETKVTTRCAPKQYDALLKAAGARGYGIETVGGDA